MKKKNLAGLIVFAASVFLAAASFADSLPEGAFKGSTPYIKEPDAMALLLKKDPANSDAYYAVLAEYDRSSASKELRDFLLKNYNRIIGVIGDRLVLTKWINRMYVYRVERISALGYAMKPLRVSAAGAIEANDQLAPDFLSLAKAGTLDGAVLSRYEKNAAAVAETIKFKGKLGSTWENFIPGNYFGSTDSTGRDYFKKGINMTLSEQKVACFSQDNIKGEFEVSEKAPGLFTFTSKSPVNVGIDKVAGRIGVFVDIVNWKQFGIPRFTTEELLLINPDDPKDVGFYYERH